MTLGPAEQAALDDLRQWLHARFGERLLEVVLFGSRARGEAHEDSDVDVAVVIEGLTSAEGREIAFFSGDLLTRYDVLVSPFVVSREHMNRLRERERLIARDIDREGIRL